MDGSMLIPEFDHEFAETRKSLERIPEDEFDRPLAYRQIPQVAGQIALLKKALASAALERERTNAPV